MTKTLTPDEIEQLLDAVKVNNLSLVPNPVTNRVAYWTKLPPDGDWHHVVIQKNGQQKKIFIDGDDRINHE